MKKIVLLILLFPIFLFGQTQIGENLYGEFGLIESLKGYSVDISDNGKRIIIGSPSAFNQDDVKTGKVEVYENINNSWVKIGQTLYGEENHDFFGISVSISHNGNVIAIGATGSNSNGSNSGLVKVFKFETDNWLQIGNDLVGEAPHDQFGKSVDLSQDGNLLLTLAPFNDSVLNNTVNVKVFSFESNSWQIKGNAINANSANSGFDSTAVLSADGSTLAIGIPVYRTTVPGIVGKVFIYKYDNNFWNEDSINEYDTDIGYGYNLSLSSDGNIVAISDPIIENGRKAEVKVFERKSFGWRKLGNSLYGISSSDNFGSSVDLSSDGKILAVGSTRNVITTNQSNSGYVQHFNFENNQWSLNKTIYGKSEGSNTGTSLALSADGNQMVVGSPFNRDNGYRSGLVSVYKKDLNDFEQIGDDLIGDFGQNHDSFGESVLLSPKADFMFIGSSNNNVAKGRVQLFNFNNGNWINTGIEFKGNKEFDNFGTTIKSSKDGNIVAINAKTTSVNSIGDSYIKVYEKSNNNWVQLGNDINDTTKLNYFVSDFSISNNGRKIGMEYNNKVYFYEYINSDWSNISVLNINPGSKDTYLYNFEFLGEDDRILVKLRSNASDKFLIEVKEFIYQNNEWIENEIIFSKEQTRDGSSVINIISKDNFIGFDFYNEGIYYTYIYEYKNGVWTQHGTEINGEAGDFYFGRKLDISNNGTIISVASLNTTKVYQLVNNEWIKIGNDIDYRSNFSIASDKNSTIAFGNPLDDTNGINAGIVKVFDYSQEILSITENTIVESFTIYPNPATNQITIDLKNENLKEVNIYNSLGQLVFKTKEKVINTSKLSTGIYFVKVKTDKGKSTKKIIINRN